MNPLGTSVGVRQKLIDALRLDLVGPDNGSALEREILPQSPARWYLTGFLVPLDAPLEKRTEESDDDQMDLLPEPTTAAADDAASPEPAPARKAVLPSSMGLSFLVLAEARSVLVGVRWGEYEAVMRTEAPGDDKSGGDQPLPYTRSDPGARLIPASDEESDESSDGRIRGYRRVPRNETVTIPLPPATEKPLEKLVPNSGGLLLSVTVRPVNVPAGAADLVTAGIRSVSVFLVNRRPTQDGPRHEGWIFQARLEAVVAEGFVSRPDFRGFLAKDFDERVADLQYRGDCELAVGHGVATDAPLDDDRQCRRVRTEWVPEAPVEWVAPADIAGVEVGMEVLAAAVDAGALRDHLTPLPHQYRSWIERQGKELGRLPPRRRETADELLNQARLAAGRIEKGIDCLGDPLVLEAFRIANRTMAAVQRRRQAADRGVGPEQIPPPRWRPFQLAFVLMNLPGIADPGAVDRKMVDLLFFPTGGGKTEAYLGLAAFTLVLRRLRNPGLASAGTTVLMRYTLRLLTIDQLGRAAALMCALELERERDPDRLGAWPFEIGLWVGRAATPNVMGRSGDGNEHSAQARTRRYLLDSKRGSPIPLENCPWCGTRFDRGSFRLVPNPDQPRDLRVGCVNRRCEFSGNRALPILSVDEPIYRRLPCFLIATVDKFAALPWNGRVGALFGKVDRHDREGFYGPCDPGAGSPLAQPLLPPELIIQDELHLISGPLGTMVGLYETAIDELCARPDGVRSKVVSSTATVRRADEQIRAIFARSGSAIFPPPGPDRRDSFFSQVKPAEEVPPRLYLGVAAQGKSPKVALLRVYLALLAAGQKLWEAEKGKRNQQNPADPYMTLVGYFNSLRELGGSRRIIEDEVTSGLLRYARRKRIGEAEGLFARRKLKEPLELTSRVSTSAVAEARRRLGLPMWEDGAVDVAIATNMISVGLDITRLGLMAVFGQPKSTSEYIQATSRVGRDPGRPGLVLTLFNIHKPRDRSHYERFSSYHRTFYRGVEASSVTPFSLRALDRGLAAAVVGLSRQGLRDLAPPAGAGSVLDHQRDLQAVAKAFAERAECHRAMTATARTALRAEVTARVDDLVDSWYGIALENQKQGVPMQYGQEIGGARPLLRRYLDPELPTLPPREQKFRAGLSLRDVESSVNLWLKSLDNRDVEAPPDEEDQPW